LNPDAEQRKVEDPLKAPKKNSTINACKGIIKGMDAQNLDIEVEEVKWRAEF
jgi:hypothetical protein